MKAQPVIIALLLCLTGALVSANEIHQKLPDSANVEQQDTLVHKTGNGEAHIVEYNLFIRETLANYTGKNVKAISVNDTIPAPTLYFTEGDTAVIHVHNEMDEETSVHWHGILLPNEQDGVPYLTTAPIKPGTTHTFVFPLKHSGTYWYHSHTMLQEQSGLYGSIVIYPKGEIKYNEQVILLSDWTDENPLEVLRSLKRQTDWYAIKKNSVQSWGEAISAGYFGDKVKQEWSRMPPMDVSDVYYNRYLINGQPLGEYDTVKPGEALRLRIINGGAATYFWLQYAGGKMKIIAADGLDVQPLTADKILIGIAETYDVEIIVPDDGMSYEFRATAQDISGYASAYFGKGMKMEVPGIPRLDYFALMRNMNQMTMNMNIPDMAGPDKMDMKNPKDFTEHMNHRMKMDDIKKDTSMPDMPGMENTDNRASVLDYSMLRSSKPTTLNPQNPVREVHLTLTGNMLRYIWSFDGKTLSQADNILIEKGENVRFILTNNTMMRHPLHLHGHFFRFINGQGDYAPLKHTFDIKPMETVTIEFYANEEKDWFFHCHILYHMISGMARIVRYENSQPMLASNQDYNHFVMEDKMWFTSGSLAPQSNGSWGNFAYSNRDWIVNIDARGDWKGDYETETHLLRFLGDAQFLSAYAGTDFRSSKPKNPQSNTKDKRAVIDAGINYLLPFFVQTELRVDHTGRGRLQFSRQDLAVTERLRLGLAVNTDEEYTINLRYILTKYFAVSANYDSDYGLGGGLTLTY